MSRLGQTQTGAFFSILASVLIFVLTAMALTWGQVRSRHPSVQFDNVPFDGAAATPTAWLVTRERGGGGK